MDDALDEASVPSLTRGTRLRFDTARSQWMLLAPERLFMLDDIAVEILRLVDGAASLGSMIDRLSTQFEAPRSQVSDDVLRLARDLADRRLLRV